MDMPIYLQFVVDSEYDAARRRSVFRHRWYVIEERGDQETAADDELGEEHWIVKSVHDRVRHLRLPHLNYDLDHSFFAVSKSRLFFVGGYTTHGPGIHEGNGILHIDLQRSDLSWERCDKGAQEFKFVGGVAVCDNGDSIYVLASTRHRLQLLRFGCRNVEEGEIMSLPPPADFWPRFCFAVSGSKMLLYGPPPLRRGNEPSHFGYYNLENKYWEESISVPGTIPARSWGFKPSALYRIVLVKESFLIHFERLGSPPKVPDCGPGLYVYDILGCKWLSKPVQGLPNDDFVLPSVETEQSIRYAYLMQVRRDVLKLALVWTRAGADYEDGTVNDQTEVHWTKFILRIEDQDNNPPTFYAECLSSGIFYGGKTGLDNCSTG